MKNYRIIPGSLAWYAGKYVKVIIVLFLILSIVVILMATNTKQTSSYAEDKQKVEEVIAEENEPVRTDFQSYDIPLDVKLQKHICEVADTYGLEPELVLAVIGQESNYLHCLIGDGGDSKGLMQVQEQYHGEVMKELGCDDLMNPYENVQVGTAVLAQYISEGGLEWGLMAYNGGPDYANEKTKQGVITEYAESVIYLSENI